LSDLLQIEQALAAKQKLLWWDTNNPHADRFAIQGNTTTMAKEGDEYKWYQLVGSDPLPKGSSVIKATIKKYGGIWQIGVGLLTESRKNLRCSGRLYDH